MLTRNDAGLELFGSAAAFQERELRSAGLTSPDIWEIPAATSEVGAFMSDDDRVMTSEPILPVGLFLADVIDVVSEHPGMELSVPTDTLLTQCKSSRQRENAKALLNVAVLSARRTADKVILRLQSLRDQWDQSDNQACAGTLPVYQEAVHVAVTAYCRQMSSNARV